MRSEKTPQQYKLASYRCKWRYEKTLLMISYLADTAILLICMRSAPNSSELWPHVLMMMAQLVSKSYIRSKHVSKSQDLLWNSLMSTFASLIPTPKASPSWNLIVFSISPCFGYLGSVVGSILLFNLIGSQLARAWWLLFSILLFVVTPFLRYALQRVRRCTIWQWDECQMCCV